MRIFFPAEYLSRISWQIFGNSVTICTCRPLASKTMDPRPIGLQAQPCTRRKHQTFLWQYGGIVAMVGKTKGYRSFISGFVLSFPTWHCKLRKPRCKCIYICSIYIWNKNWGKIPMYHHHPKNHWYSQSHFLRFKVVQEWFNMFQYMSYATTGFGHLQHSPACVWSVGNVRFSQLRVKDPSCSQTSSCTESAKHVQIMQDKLWNQTKLRDVFWMNFRQK